MVLLCSNERNVILVAVSIGSSRQSSDCCTRVGRPRVGRPWVGRLWLGRPWLGRGPGGPSRGGTASPAGGRWGRVPAGAGQRGGGLQAEPSINNTSITMPQPKLRLLIQHEPKWLRTDYTYI